MLNHYDVHLIIAIGYADEVGKPIHNKVMLDYFRHRDFINRLGPDSWRNSRKEFEDDIQLIWLFKGLVILERELKWNGGSVAGAIWVYRMIEQARLDEDFKIADYGLRNCDNPYIPFGNSYYGKRSITDYFAHINEKAKASAIKADRYNKVLKRVEGRKEKRAAAIAELRKLNKEERGQVLKDLQSKFNSATSLERLQLIAGDEKYPPEYYPVDWIKLTPEEIQNLPLDLRKKIYDKLSTKTKGEWKRFAHELEKLDDGI